VVSTLGFASLNKRWQTAIIDENMKIMEWIVLMKKKAKWIIAAAILAVLVLALGQQEETFESKNERNGADISDSYEQFPEEAEQENDTDTTEDMLKKNALEEYTNAININPNDSISYISRGVVYHELNEYEKALKDYT